MEALGDKLSSIIIDHDYQLYICLSQISDLLGENAFKRLSLHCIMIVMNKKKKKNHSQSTTLIFMVLGPDFDQYGKPYTATLSKLIS